MCQDEFPGPLGRPVIQQFAPARFTGDGSHGGGQIKQRVLFFQRVERMVHGLDKRCAGPVQARIARQTAGNVGQWLAAEYLLNQGRIDVGHAIAKARRCAGAAVVQFIGVQDQRVAGYAVTQRALVMKALHPRQRAADGVGVVPVRVIAMPTEPGLDSLYLTGLGIADDPVGGGGRFASIHCFNVR